MKRILFFWLVVMAMFQGSKMVVAEGKKVLVVLSGVDFISLQDGKKFKTGLFLSELTEAFQALRKKGYSITFSNPNGSQPAIDPASDSAKWFASEHEYKIAKQQLLSADGFAKPRRFDSFSELELERFSGIFVPGGYAPMEDLPKDKALGLILNHFHSKQKPTALICHGPIALLAQKVFLGNGDWAYQGYQTTIVSRREEVEEEAAGHLGGLQLYYVEESLRSAGAIVSVAAPWTSNVARDREVLTGQNPMSAKALVAAFMAALDERI